MGRDDQPDGGGGGEFCGDNVISAFYQTKVKFGWLSFDPFILN